MIEVSLIDIVLMIWAGAATGFWFSTRDELRSAKVFIRAFLEDEEIRNKVLDEHKKFMARRQA